MQLKRINISLIIFILGILQIIVTSITLALTFLYPASQAESFFFLTFLGIPIVVLGGILSLIFEKEDKSRKKMALIGIGLAIAIPAILIVILIIQVRFFGKGFIMGL